MESIVTSFQRREYPRMDNPYRTPVIEKGTGHAPIRLSVWRFVCILILAMICVVIPTAVFIDCSRERLGATGNLIFILIAASLPGLVGFVFTYFARKSDRTNFHIWLLASILATMPSLFVWCYFANLPAPRIYSGKGQMHVYILPPVLFLWAAFVYLTAGVMSLLRIIPAQTRSSFGQETDTSSF